MSFRWMKHRCRTSDLSKATASIDFPTSHMAFQSLIHNRRYLPLSVPVHTCLHLMLPFLSGCLRVKGESESESESERDRERSPIPLREHTEITGGL